MVWDGIDHRKGQRRSLNARRVLPERRVAQIGMRQGFDTALRKAGFKGTILTHWMPWHGDGHYHPGVPYSQNDDRIIGLQLDVMQSVGVQGVIATWQGPATSGARAFGHQATQKMCAQLAARGMRFALLLDPWVCKQQAKPQQVVIDALNHPETKAMLSSSAYLPEKYVLDFIGKNVADNLGVSVPLDWTAIAKATGVSIISRKVGYSWPEILSNGLPMTPAQSVAVQKTQNAASAMKIPGLSMQFFDGGWLKSDGSIDWTQQSWSDKTSVGPTRMMENCAGKWFFDQMGVTPLGLDYVAWVTWNDYNERTAIEPWAAMISAEGIF